MVWCNQNSCMPYLDVWYQVQHVRNDFIYASKRLPLHGTVPFLTIPSILTLNEVVLLLFQLVLLQLFAVRYCVDAIMFSAPQFINPHKHFYGLVFFLWAFCLQSGRRRKTTLDQPTLHEKSVRRSFLCFITWFHWKSTCVKKLAAAYCKESEEWTWIMRTPFGCFWGF